VVMRIEINELCMNFLNSMNNVEELQMESERMVVGLTAI
jgi:hypothetical protein